MKSPWGAGVTTSSKVTPATTIFPSGCTAMPWTMSAVRERMSSVTRPPWPKLPSSVPLGPKRARAKSLLPLASLTPATRILPSGWSARA